MGLNWLTWVIGLTFDLFDGLQAGSDQVLGRTWECGPWRDFDTSFIGEHYKLCVLGIGQVQEGVLMTA